MRSIVRGALGPNRCAINNRLPKSAEQRYLNGNLRKRAPRVRLRTPEEKPFPKQCDCALPFVQGWLQTEPRRGLLPATAVCMIEETCGYPDTSVLNDPLPQVRQYSPGEATDTDSPNLKEVRQ